MNANRECDLCANPYPYMCSECDDMGNDGPAVAAPAVAVAAPAVMGVLLKAAPARVWIGSGEDMPPRFAHS